MMIIIANLLKHYMNVRQNRRYSTHGGDPFAPSLVRPKPTPRPANSPKMAPGGPIISPPDIAIDRPVDTMDEAYADFVALFELHGGRHSVALPMYAAHAKSFGDL